MCIPKSVAKKKKNLAVALHARILRIQKFESKCRIKIEWLCFVVVCFVLIIFLIHVLLLLLLSLCVCYVKKDGPRGGFDRPPRQGSRDDAPRGGSTQNTGGGWG